MSDTIKIENEKPGSLDWMLSNPRFDEVMRYRCPAIEGYCSRSSVRAGERVKFYVSANPPQAFTIDIFRTGYYGGKGARLLRSLGKFDGRTQADPPAGELRLRECQWEAAAELEIPADWVSGVYLAKLKTESGIDSYIVFIVRDERRADFIFKCSDTTWHSYNRWPHWYSLYDNGKTNWYTGPGVEISFDRPMTKYCTILSDDSPNARDWHDQPLSTGSGEWLLWEHPFAFWMESLGYDVTYISSIDAHADRAGLLRARGILSVGHDEYYTREMYNNMLGAVEAGVSLGFFSGNSVNGVIELSPNSAGVPHRRLKRVDMFGLRDEGLCKNFAGMGEFPYRSPDDGLLMGARNTYPITGGADWLCTRPSHWIYQGTGMKQGDRIMGLIGWEWRGNPAPIPGLTVVSEGTTHTKHAARTDGHYTATVHSGPKRNIVFNASTIWWADALANPPGYRRPSVYTTPQGPDKRVQKMTANVLKEMIRR